MGRWLERRPLAAGSPFLRAWAPLSFAFDAVSAPLQLPELVVEDEIVCKEDELELVCSEDPDEETEEETLLPS